VFLSLKFFGHEGEKRQAVLLANLAVGLLLTKIIEKLVGECFCSIEALLWRVDHNLADKVQKERVSFGEDLDRERITLFH
jgi:hypothetical protein